MDEIINLTKYDNICIIIFVLLWLYTSLCLFIICIGGINMYSISTPMMDTNTRTLYQIYSYIPLCMFTDYFNKKIYDKDVFY